MHQEKRDESEGQKCHKEMKGAWHATEIHHTNTNQNRTSETSGTDLFLTPSPSPLEK